MYKNSKRAGMALSLVVVVLGVMGIAMALVVTYVGLSRAITQSYAERDLAARAVLYGCHDEVNAQLRRSASFAATEVSIGTAQCSATIVANGTTRTVTLTYTTSPVTKSLTYVIDTANFTISNQTER